MIVWLDGHFWSRHFRQGFIPQVNAFCDAVINRVLPTFAGIAKEADDVAQAEYQRVGSLSATESEILDMADIAERAQEAGLVYYEALEGVRQSLTNLAAAALYHMFEQQLLLFHRKQVLHPSEEDNISKIKIGELKKRLLDGGLDIESLESWPKVDELRLVANCVKHAEGVSSEKLGKLRSDLFVHPASRDEDLARLSSSARVYLPLAGQDVYVTVDDFEAYRSAVVLFWEEFGNAIRQHSNR
jgi:hypothetical protein